jgi:hypothetical protein
MTTNPTEPLPDPDVVPSPGPGETPPDPTVPDPILPDTEPVLP